MVKVIVNSMPKSGTHLVGKLVSLAGFQRYHNTLTGAFLRETNRNPITRWRKRTRKTLPNSDYGLPMDLGLSENWVKKDWLHNFLTQVPDGGYILAHLPFDSSLSDFLVIHDFRIIYIYRDPRDILVSYINYLKQLKTYPLQKDLSQMSREESVSAILYGLEKGRVKFSPLNVQLERSKGWISDSNTLSVRFEDLIGPKGHGDAASQKIVVSKILNQIGISASEERLNNIVDKVFDTSSKTFNKGKVSQWKDWFNTPDMAVYVDQLTQAVSEYGYG